MKRKPYTIEYKLGIASVTISCMSPFNLKNLNLAISVGEHDHSLSHFVQSPRIMSLHECQPISIDKDDR